MKIFNEIKNSIYNEHYYRSLPGAERMRTSIKYLAKLSLHAALVSVIIFSFFIPIIYTGIKESTASLVASYPDDLIISIKNGVASTNKPGPYVVPIGKLWGDGKDGEGALRYKNFIVVDTSAPFSLEQFKSYSSIVVLSKTEVAAIKNFNNQIQIMPLTKISNLQISKPVIVEKEAFLLSLLPLLIFMLMLAVLVFMFLINFFGTLLILFFYALVIWLMAKIAKTELSYKNSYKLGIHAVTILVILGTFNMFLGSFYNFFTRLLILMIVIYINYFNHNSKK